MGLEKKFNFTYQTKNLINGKLYVGTHTTDDLDDGYIGSGMKRNNWRHYARKGKTPFTRAVAKYGYENFVTTPLAFFDTRKEAYEEEAWIVDQKWIDREDTYNVTLGGFIPPLQTKENYPRSKEYLEKLSKARSGKKSYFYLSDIYQIDINTKEILGKYHTANQAGIEIGRDGHGIAGVLRGDALSAFGYYWTRDPKKLDEEHKEFKARYKAKIDSRYYAKPILMCDPDTQEIIKEFPSIEETYRYIQTNITFNDSTPNLLYNIKKEKNFLGYFWKYKNEQDKWKKKR